MASPTDQLRTLPPELREYIYSNLISVGGDSTVRIRQRQNSGEGSLYPEDPPTVLALYDHWYPYFPRERIVQWWPDGVHEAFFQALSWINKQHPRNQLKIGGWSHNQIISELIYELKGEVRSRKQVSSHLHVLEAFLHRRATKIPECVDMEQASEVMQPRPAVSYEKSPVLIENSEIFRYLSAIVCNPNDGLSVHCNTNSAKDLFSLGSVSRLFRAECLHHLASNLPLDFQPDSRALHHFCSTAPVELLTKMRHLRVTLVEGYMPPQLPALPKLRALMIDLWPRNPTRPCGKGWAWGTQTEMLLAGLGVVVAVRARIRLEMRWDADCERFEREYVEKGRWRYSR